MTGKKEVTEYIGSFPKNVQTILRKIRKLVKEVAPQGQETIVYKIPTVKINDKNLVHFAGHTKHIGFYPTPTGIEKFKKELKTYKTSKGSVQFPLSEPIPYDLIRKITEFRVKELSGSPGKVDTKGTQKTSGPIHSLPKDLREAINSKIAIKKAWDSLTPLARNEWICWVISAKKDDTRAKRIGRALEELKEGKKRPCCWPGCPHRRPNAAKWFSNKPA